jgi:hypothetical protein
MKIRATSLLCSFSLLLSGAAAARAQVLFTENFETPTGHTFSYPVTTGFRSHLDGRADGWAGSGRVEVTYARRLGLRDSGGIRLSVTEPSTDFAVLNLRIPIRNMQPGAMTTAWLQALRLRVSVMGTTDRKITPSIHVPAKNAPWASRLRFPTVTLSPEWKQITLDFSQIPESQLRVFLDEYNIGDRAELVFSLYLDPARSWSEGDFIQVDELQLASGNR